MKNKVILAIILIIGLASHSYCQNDFRSGFIITSGNDTIKAQVAYRSNLSNYKSCICKGVQGEIEYLPNQIRGFGYDDYKVFSSGIIENSFVEVLVSGKISLYKSLHKYHLKKDTSRYDLQAVFEEVEIDGKSGMKDNNIWRGITTYLISDCISNPSSVVSRTSLEDKSLTKLIVDYNTCTGSDFAEYKVNKPWIKYEFGAMVGLARSEINIKNRSVWVPYLADAYSSTDPTIGIVMNISAPRITEKITFQGEIQYMKSNYSSLVVLNWSTTDYHDTYISLSTLSVPLSLKYSFPEKKVGWYLQGGINYDYNLNAEARLVSESVSGNVVTTLPEKEAFEIRKNQFGYWGGFGILKSYQKYKVSLAVRYFQISSLNVFREFTTNFHTRDNRISLNLILFKK